MSKDEGVRITDTIDFIRTAAVPPANALDRVTVANLLQDRYDNNRISDLVSPAMSQGGNTTIFGRDQVKEYRHYRRAIILIRMALQNADRSVAPREVAQITDANLSAMLGDYLHQVTATLQDLTAKLALLESTPLDFLSNNTFNMIGASTSAPMDYEFFFDPLANQYNLGSKAATGHLAAVPVDVFQLGVQPYSGLARTDKPGGHSLDVAGSRAHGGNLMVTTQLTGCAVVYYLNGATLVVAHVQPTGIGAEAMCTNLRADATLSNAPGKAVTGVFGAQAVKGADPNNYQKAGHYNYCVGVCIGGSWDLYAQQRQPGKGGAKTAWKIT